VVTIGADVHAQVTPDQVPAILERYLQQVRQEGKAGGPALTVAGPVPTETRSMTPREFGLRFPCYTVALLALVLATFVRWLLHPVLGHHYPLATYYAALACAAWACGIPVALP